MPELGTVSGGIRAAAGLLPALRLGHVTKRNNRLVLREYEDLIRWVRDDSEAEARALAAVEREMHQRGIRGSGIHGQEEGRVRDEFARRWRDRKSAAERRLEDIRDSENVLHAAWRRVVRRPWPTNPDEEELRVRTNGWESRLQ